MKNAALLASLAFFCTCQGNTDKIKNKDPEVNPVTVAPTPAANNGSTVLLEVSVPTEMRRKDRIFFTFNLVEPWDHEIRRSTISVSLTHTTHVLLQKKDFSAKDANTMGTNRVFSFSSLLVARKKGDAKITIKAFCKVCDSKGKCNHQKVVRDINFLIR